MKLQNKSKNLREILDAVLEGKTVQYKHDTNKWMDETIPYNVLEYLEYKWRVKPNPIEDAYDIHVIEMQKIGFTQMSFNCFRAGWDAAMQEKK